MTELKELIEENFVYIACNFTLYEYFHLNYLWSDVAGYNNTYYLMMKLYDLMKKKYGDKIFNYEKWRKRRKRIDQFHGMPYHHYLN